MGFARHYQMNAGDGRAPALHEALLRLAARLRALDGCEAVDLMRDVDKADTFIVLERWTSRDAHVASAQTLGRDAFSDVMSALAEPPASRSLEILDT